MASAEVRRQLIELKGQLAAALKAEPDRRARRKIAEKYQLKIDQLKGAVPDSDDEDGGDEANPRSGPSQSFLKQQARDSKRQAAYQERVERLSDSDLSQREELAIAARLPPGTEIEDEPADGSCLYHALKNSLARQNIGSYTVMELRNTIADFLRDHADEFSCYVVETPFDQYIAELREPTTHGGELEISACARLFDVSIAVITGDGIIKYGDAEKSTRRHVDLVYFQHKFGSRKFCARSHTLSF